MIVHRETEQNGKRPERHPCLDDVHLLEAEQLVAHAFLKHQHQQPIGGAHGEQIHNYRLDRDDNRAEHDRKQDEAKAEHECDDNRCVVFGRIDVVD